MSIASDLIIKIVQHDRKASTYKLGLLRSLYRIAYTIQRSKSLTNLSLENYGGFVHIPSGMVGLYWIRLYLPLIVAQLPQHPEGKACTFEKGAFLELMKVPNLNLRMGNKFENTMAILVHKSIQQVAKTIKSKPVKHITFNGNTSDNAIKVFEMSVVDNTSPPQSLTLDSNYLSQFGKFSMPQEIWEELIIGDNWIEYTIEDKWVEMIANYMKPKKGRNKVPNYTKIDTEKIHDALRWIE